MKIEYILITLFFLLLLDLASTVYAVNLGAIEGNPLLADSITRFNFGWIAIIWKIILPFLMLPLLYYYYKKEDTTEDTQKIYRFFLTIFCFIVAIVVVNNLIIIGRMLSV